MADVTYLLGSNPYHVAELERTALSDDYTPANWTYSLVMKKLGEAFDGATETWVAAAYELATDSEGETHHTVKALLTDLITVRGQYTTYVRLVNAASEAETPQYIPVSGIATVK